MEKNMEHEMETGIMRWVMGITISQNWGSLLEGP